MRTVLHCRAALVLWAAHSVLSATSVMSGPSLPGILRKIKVPAGGLTQTGPLSNTSDTLDRTSSVNTCSNDNKSVTAAVRKPLKWFDREVEEI